VNDAFSPGTRIPSIREFARTHKVSRFTVVEAYDRLVAMGYLEARRGSGFYTTHRSEEASWSEVDVNRARGFDVAWMIRHVLEERGENAHGRRALAARRMARSSRDSYHRAPARAQ
jgi:DNA-binding GntR family transcriptional regulator